MKVKKRFSCDQNFCLIIKYFCLVIRQYFVYFFNLFYIALNKKKKESNIQIQVIFKLIYRALGLKISSGTSRQRSKGQKVPSELDKCAQRSNVISWLICRAKRNQKFVRNLFKGSKIKEPPLGLHNISQKARSSFGTLLYSSQLVFSIVVFPQKT